MGRSDRDCSRQRTSTAKSGHHQTARWQVLSFAMMWWHAGVMLSWEHSHLTDHRPLTCRWSAAKQDFLKALQLDAASGAKDNAALLNNLGVVRPHKPKRHIYLL